MYVLLTNFKAGILCVQLFSDCEDNFTWIESGPEDFRWVALVSSGISTAKYKTDEVSDVWFSRNLTRS